MNESFLHFLWRWRRFDARDLQTTQGETLEILHPGEWNHHAGPDFFNARIRLGDTLWAGNVEIHQRASEWLSHGHTSDPAYDNVVLHVVLEEDQPVVRPGGERLPCLELKKRVPPSILEQYRRLQQERQAIPCRQFWHQTPEIIRHNWLDRMVVERLEQKTGVFAQLLAAAENHWDEAFYRLLARNFGLKINVEPFEALARSLPLNILSRHRTQLFQLEALLFGQSGMLEEPRRDDYPRALAREYLFLQRKYGLAPINGDQWKFLRLRPAGFPTVRLAQFAALMHRSTHLFSSFLDANSALEVEQMLDVTPDGYWLDHYCFDRESVKRPKNLGHGFRRLLAVNAVVPALFHWGKTKKQDVYVEMALNLLQNLPPETNTVLDQWVPLGMPPKNAAESQALLQLKTHWCDYRRCLECAVGNSILK